MTRTPLLLNVNDHVANLYVVSKMLRNAGYRVIEARTGAEALALAQSPETKPDLVVLDVRLPDMSGFEVCRRLKTDPRTQDTKVLHTSATFTSTDNKIEGLDAGADGYLTQPFETQDLIATVRSLIRLHRVETDLHARNTTLVDADRRKDEFLAMLAHELRNPLAAIQMGLPILERFPPRDEIEGRTIGILYRQTALLVQLVDDLLDVSRVTRGRIDLQRQPLDLGALVSSICDGLRDRIIAPREQHLVLDTPSQPIWIEGDPGRLEQVLTNLVDNASKYSDRGTEITVALRADGDAAELSVRDRGIGIDAAMLPFVFELFAQATTSLARSHGGLGIGLTLVRALVELHGGTIVAESTGLGAGSTFRVRLPVVARPEAAAPRAQLPTSTAQPRRILLVDDNDDARELLRLLCERAGHVVEEARDGLEGIDAALAFRPDLALVDIGLPGCDGYEVARRIREREHGHRTRLIALTGYGSEEHRRLAKEAGFDEHVIKPLDREKLARILA
jgi:signal transduction histidine kinase